jgi:hypothetical protein
MVAGGDGWSTWPFTASVTCGDWLAPPSSPAPAIGCSLCDVCIYEYNTICTVFKFYYVKRQTTKTAIPHLPPLLLSQQKKEESAAAATGRRTTTNEEERRIWLAVWSERGA